MEVRCFFSFTFHSYKLMCRRNSNSVDTGRLFYYSCQLISLDPSSMISWRHYFPIPVVDLIVTIIQILQNFVRSDYKLYNFFAHVFIKCEKLELFLILKLEYKISWFSPQAHNGCSYRRCESYVSCRQNLTQTAVLWVSLVL